MTQNQGKHFIVGSFTQGGPGKAWDWQKGGGGVEELSPTRFPSPYKGAGSAAGCSSGIPWDPHRGSVGDFPRVPFVSS